MPGILVGIDGSAHSQRAVEWTAKEAAVAEHAKVPVMILPA